MTITYEDVVDVVHEQVRADNRRVDVVVIEENVIDEWKENMVRAELGDEPEDSPMYREDVVGQLNGFVVREGDESKIVCEDGTEYEL